MSNGAGIAQVKELHGEGTTGVYISMALPLTLQKGVRSSVRFGMVSGVLSATHPSICFSAPYLLNSRDELRIHSSLPEESRAYSAVNYHSQLTMQGLGVSIVVPAFLIDQGKLIITRLLCWLLTLTTHTV